MEAIIKLGFVEYGVPDLLVSANFYESILGLIKVEASEDKLYYKCWDEYDHHSLVLTKSDKKGLIKVGFKVHHADDLEAFERKLNQYGVKTHMITKDADVALGAALTFVSPFGHNIWLYSEIEQVGKSVTLPEIAPQNTNGLAPMHLDHILLSAPDVDQALEFFTSVLNFRVSEKVVDDDGHVHVFFLFVGGHPHDLAIIRGPAEKFHHVAFSAEDNSDVLQAYEFLNKNKCKVIVPPSQHGATRGKTTYFYDPNGYRLEIFSGGYTAYPDMPIVTWRLEDLPKALFYSGGPVDLPEFMEWI